MNLLHTERLTIMETPHIRDGMLGPLDCVAFNVWCKGEQFPSIFAASGLLVDLSRQNWLLSYIQTEDEGRRLGFATEIVRFYEERLGSLDACWASDSGAAFARRYVERFGPRPRWQIGTTEEVEQLYLELNKKRGVA